LDDDLIVVDSESASKEEALEELVDAFHAAGRTDQPQLVEEAIWLREAVYTTGLGHGFAVPHCKTDAITANSIGVLRLKKPIAWDAVDDQPVQCVILLVVRAAEDGSAHMKIFSRLARKLMHDEFRARLLAAPERAAMRRYLAAELGLTT
ncbi:MAG TPA: PTS sugar transporter subunit IIA, partial [Phycisphaerae bacterium]|nr:PTS sugar transporter subunit IIA [Phycisphaerae bacterium]